MTDFETSTDPHGVTVVVSRGRLNMVAARTLRTLLADLVEQGSTRLVVDLEETSFIDSSGLGALISGLKAARQVGGDLRIARPTAEVVSVLELTNLDKVLRPRDTVAGAFDD